MTELQRFGDRIGACWRAIIEKLDKLYREELAGGASIVGEAEGTAVDELLVHYHGI